MMSFGKRLIRFVVCDYLGCSSVSVRTMLMLMLMLMVDNRKRFELSDFSL